MFGSGGAESYLFNQIIFLVLVGVFALAGYKVAGSRVEQKKDNKKAYFSVALSYPFSFLVGFFVIDSVWSLADIQNKLGIPYSKLLCWVAIIISGLLLGFLVSSIILRKQMGKER